MMKISRTVLTAAAALMCLASVAAGPASAQTATYQELHRFSAPYRAAEAPLVYATNGKLYGLFQMGGPNDAGLVYSLTPDGAGRFTFAVVHEFVGSDGIAPSGLIQASDGNFYGTTRGISTGAGGSVFKMTAAGAVTTLATFAGWPAAGVTEGRDGRLYGALQFDFPATSGTVFVLDKDGGNFETLHEFTGGDGARPASALVQGIAPDDDFYGTTSEGGAGGAGTIFKITPSGTFTPLHSFPGATGGQSPGGLTFGADGHLYGSTMIGGAHDNGTIFRVTTAGAFSKIHDFSIGGFPSGVLTRGADDRLYGFTLSGSGTIFAIDSTDTLSTVKFLQFAEGVPGNDLVLGPDGLLFGSTAGGGLHNVGIAFSLSASGDFTKLVDFPSVGGSYAYGGLVEAPNGMLFGTTGHGAAKNIGNVFRLDPATGVVSDVHDFLGTDGGRPWAGLTLGPNGFLYGTTASGGASFTPAFFESGFGTVFAQNPLGGHSTVHSFSGSDGSMPMAPPVFGSDQQIYGTTTSSFSGAGTVYKFDRTGAFTTLHEFPLIGTEPASPSPAPLVEGHDGQMYGTTGAGGAHGFGTVYSIDASGTVTTLHSFSGSDGMFPRGLQLGSDGSFMGVTQQGGNSSGGTLFQITPAGALTTLLHFEATTGSSPSGPPIEAGDGQWYGVTAGGGSLVGGFLGSGTVYRWSAAGHEVLFTFDVFNTGTLSSPVGTLVQARDNKLYGTTFGPAGGVYSLTVPGLTNRRPTAAGQSVTTTEDAPVDIMVGSSDPDGDTVTFVVVDDPDHGTLTGFGPNFTYMPHAGYTGPDVFRVRASDGTVSSNIAAVEITVTLAGNTAPVADDQSVTTDEDTAVNITLTASDADGDLLTYTVVASPQHGTLSGTAPNVIYTPNAGYSGPDSFTFKANDGTVDSNIATVSITVTLATIATTTALHASAATIGALQAVTLVAIVSPVPPGAGVPGGGVEFLLNGTTLLGTASLLGGVASITTNGLPIGGHVITARYVGAGTFTGSTSAPLTITVQPLAASSFTFLIPWTNPQALGSPVVASALVVPLAGPTPTGTVEFYEGTALVGTATLSGGLATTSWTPGSVGAKTISARYLGSATSAPSTSQPAIITIYAGAAPATTTTTLAVAPSPSTVGQPVTFTATVSRAVPVGSLVTFYADGVSVGTAPIALVGGTRQAVLTTSALPAGVHVVSASYVGAPGFAASNSPLALLIVNP